jgi:hypothetical protein
MDCGQSEEMAAPLSTESFAHEGIEEDITQDDL